jgi:hypothetical protein
MKNQTAVEYLIDALSPVIAIRLSEIYIKELTEQALAMEKKQIIEAYYIGADEESDHHGAMYKDKDDAEQYYKQTYNL